METQLTLPSSRDPIDANERMNIRMDPIIRSTNSDALFGGKLPDRPLSSETISPRAVSRDRLESLDRALQLGISCGENDPDVIARTAKVFLDYVINETVPSEEEEC